MKFTIYGEGITINDSTREEIEKRLAFLNKYFVVDDSTTSRINVKKYEYLHGRRQSAHLP